jgi:hypothetical protein
MFHCMVLDICSFTERALNGIVSQRVLSIGRSPARTASSGAQSANPKTIVRIQTTNLPTRFG